MQKFLILQIKHARLIVDKPNSNMLGENRFFHPITMFHIYNSICVLLDRTPKPQFRKTDDKYMPFFNDIMDVVSKGYVKIQLISEYEKVTTVKKDWNSTTKSASQYTWKDCSYATGTLLPIFIYHLSEIFQIKESNIKKIPFDSVIKNIQSKGFFTERNEMIYEDEKIKKLIAWCKLNSISAISNYIENKQEETRSRFFGKRVYRGCVDANKYNGTIYIPLTDDLFNEMIKYTKGFSNILDGGLVKIVDFDELKEDEFIGFIPIQNLNSTRKFYERTSPGIVWSNTIYKKLKGISLIDEINGIIDEAGVSITDNQKTYDEMIKKVSAIKFNKDEVKNVAYKVNHFIENSINKKYK